MHIFSPFCCKVAFYLCFVFRGTPTSEFESFAREVYHRAVGYEFVSLDNIALKFKMGNFRTKLARSGCAEVSINAGKRSLTNPENDHPHSNIKRARRAEVNFLPNFPRGENETTLEEMRAQIIQETEKTERDQILIEKLMQTAFALRCQHIVQGSPQVREFLENWPALRMQSQVFAEFHRITNVNLRNQFYCELDRYTPKLVALYRQKSSRTGKGAEALREMLRIYDLEEEHDINMRRSLALRALSSLSPGG